MRELGQTGVLRCLAPTIENNIDSVYKGGVRRPEQLLYQPEKLFFFFNTVDIIGLQMRLVLGPIQYVDLVYKGGVGRGQKQLPYLDFQKN